MTGGTEAVEWALTRDDIISGSSLTNTLVVEVQRGANMENV